MDSSKLYINREPCTLDDIGYATDIRLTSKPSLLHHFSLYLVTSVYLWTYTVFRIVFSWSHPGSTSIMYQAIPFTTGRMCYRVKLVWIRVFPFYYTGWLTKAKEASLAQHLLLSREEVKGWIQTFHKSIWTKRNANCFIQNLISDNWFHFLRW